MAQNTERLKNWIYSQEGITITSLANRLSCPVDTLIVKVKQLTKIQPKGTDLLPRTFLINNLDSLQRAVETIHKKEIIKPKKTVQKQFKSAKKHKTKKKVLQNKINYKQSSKIDGGMLGDTSGESVKIKPMGFHN